MHRVTRTVGKEQAIKLVTDGVEIEVPREYGHCCITTNEGTKNVRLGTKVENSNSDIPIGVEEVWNLCGNLGDEVLSRRIPVLLRSWRRSRGICTDGKPAEGGSLVTQQARDFASIHASDTRDVKAAAPGSEGFDCSVVRKFLCDVCNYNGTALNSLGFHNDTNILRVNGGLVARNPIISDERGGEDKDLAPVRGVGHGLGVWNWMSVEFNQI